MMMLVSMAQASVATMANSAPAAVDAAVDFSLVGMWQQAGLVVKIVMVILALASVWAWAIALDKQLLFGRLRREARRFEETFWSGRSLEELASSVGDRPRDAMGRVFAAAMREWRESRARGAARDGGAVLSLTERIDRVMGLVVAREVNKAQNGLGVLASIGSAAPFIGLFGTVWGIINAFRDIGISENASLVSVAPGIAEALLATALGLAAAIPAVIFYNKYSTDLANFAGQVEGYADELSAILSRRAQERAA